MVFWQWCLAAAVSAGVVVDGDTKVVLGQQSAISSNLFGLTAFEGFTSVVADPDYRARVLAIRPGCVRLAGNVAWYAPAADEPGGLETPAAARLFEQTLLFGNRYPTGRFLPLVRQLGAEPMCSLGAPPPYLTQAGTSHPSDLSRWADYCAGMVALWRRHDPAFRLVQIWNEPNASWFRDPRAGKGGGALHHIEMANLVARRLKARFPNLLVGGPVLCWPPSWPPDQQGQQPWYTWDQWTVPWLERTKDTIDFFDFHVYGVSADDLAVQCEMLVNQAELTQQRRLPVWITESNYDLRPEELNDAQAIWTKRVLPYERFLLSGVLPQADKLAGNLYHDLHARSYTLLPRGADDPDPMYWLFWVLRDLRGTRLVADIDDPLVKVVATLEEDRVTVVLFNDSPTERAVPFAAYLPGGWWTGPECRSIGQGPDGALARLNLAPKLERNRQGAAGPVTLPAWATLSVSFRLDRFHQPSRERRRQETFGDATRRHLAGTAPVTVQLPRPADARGPAVLRLGLLGATGQEPLAATLNGRPLPIAAKALQEVPLASVPLGDRNTLAVRLTAPVANPRLAVAFASLVHTTGP